MSETLTSTMRITEATKKDLVKIGAQVSLKDGKERSLEDIVKLLVDHYHNTSK